ncbi:hypothetical protein [uncultured Georgenia sp.]|uniref:hypothetical protein n=1 Tax=uncultured Georgenia sp. TaxID=378209 RepID=UPI0026362F82|nr:hypothetical protein [uncultured Georgenia sp.]HLV05727.1 hypothetical protein [Actinomycetaceae bacterium]
MTSQSPLRAMFRTVMRQLAVLLAVLGVGGSVIGYLAVGTPGLWGALLGTALVAFFMLTTALVMLATADKPLHVASAAFIGSWLAKVVIVFVVLLLLRDRDFYHPLVFFVTLSLAILGSIAIEMSAALKARVPNVDPGAGAAQDDAGA